MCKFCWKWLAGATIVLLVLTMLHGTEAPRAFMPHVQQSAAPIPAPNLPTPTAPQQSAVGHSNGVGRAVSFEPNVGQADAAVSYLAHGQGYALLLSPSAATLRLSAVAAPPTTLQLSLLGASLQAQLRGERALIGRSNYLIGSDPASWRVNVPNFAAVRYANVYPGIDMLWYGRADQFEYDFVVAAGADPNVIRLAISGAERVSIAGGELVLQVGGKQLRQAAPHIYQATAYGPRTVAGSYQLVGDKVVGFTLAAYDRRQPLVIDPPLAFATYFGGQRDDAAQAVAVDSQRNLYITGASSSTDFYTTTGALQPSYGGGQDAFVSKVSGDGQTLIYSTYLGGDAADVGRNLVVDASGNAYVVGSTNSANFPTQLAIQPTYGGGGDGFVAKLNPSGSSLVYATYLGGGGSDVINSIGLSGGAAYVVGTTNSTDFPTAGSPLQPSYGGGSNDGFVTVLNVAGTALTYSTYLGRSDDDQAMGVAVQDGIYVAGATTSANFYTTTNALQPSYAGLADGFLTKLTLDGATVAYATYLGGGLPDAGIDVAADPQGQATIVGWTASNDFVTSPGAFQPNLAGGLFDAFVTRLNTVATPPLVYSTYLGGRRADFANRVDLDLSGVAYLVGTSYSTDFPTLNPVQASNGGLSDAVVAALAPDGTALRFATYLGGSNFEQGLDIAADELGNAYVVGSTRSANFPTLNPLQAARRGSADGFIARLGNATPSPTTTATASPTDTPLPLTTPSDTPTPSVTPNHYRNTVTPSVTPSATASATPNPQVTDTPSVTPITTALLPSPTLNPQSTETPSVTATPTATLPPTETATVPPTTSVTPASTMLPSVTATAANLTETPTASPAPPTDTPAASATVNPSTTLVPSDTPLPSATVAPLPSDTPLPATPTQVTTATITLTPPPSATATDCPNPFVDINGNIFYNAIHYFTCQGIILGMDPTHFYPAMPTTRGQFTRLVIKGFGIPILTPSGGQSFTDVPPGFYAYLYVESGYAAGILTGYTPAQCAGFGLGYPCYQPNREINRAELTRLVVKAARYTIIIPPNPTFVDVPTTHFAYRYIETAYAHGVIRGVDSSHFEPSRGIRRDEMCQIIYNGITMP